MITKLLLRKLAVYALAGTLIFLQGAGGTQASPVSSNVYAESASPVMAQETPAFLNTLNPVHPRLLATWAEFEAVGQKVQQDPVAARWYIKLKARADQMLGEPPVQYALTNNSMLEISRKVIDRVYTLGLVYKLDPNPVYLNRIWTELNAAAGFPDWHPAEYLDAAEMIHAFAIGYDWFYHDWSSGQRDVIRNALLQKGLLTALPTYRGENVGPPNQWFWLTSKINWNVVANSGVSLGALAIADEQPELAAELLEGAYNSIQLGLSEFLHDGAYPEGIGYWDYATKYAVAYFAGLESALGTDYGLSGAYGFPLTGDFPVYMTGPQQSFNYGDAVSAKLRSGQLTWMGSRFGIPAYQDYQEQNAVPSAEDLLWYDPGLTDSGNRSKDRLFDSIDVALFRSGWNDPYGVFAGIKGGDNQSNHNDLDLGTFVIDALGERWAEELGAEDYSSPGYWDTGANGSRWGYYRKRAEGQNTLVMNPSLAPDQNTLAKAKIIRFESGKEDAFAVVDLTEAYAPHASHAVRGIRMLDERRQVLVQDEIETDGTSDMWWFMHTKADVQIAPDGKSAVLQIGAKRMLVKLLGGGGERFQVMAAKPLWTSPQPDAAKPNSDVRKLAVHLNGEPTVTLSVLFAPLPEGTQAADIGIPAIEPIAAWMLKPASPASVQDIRIDEASLAGYSPDDYTYYVTRPIGSAVPVVSASAYGDTAAQVIQAQSIPGTAYVDAHPAGEPEKLKRYAIHFVTGASSSPRDIDGLPVAAVTASSDADHTAASTIDNSFATRWSAEGEQWIQYDLGSPAEIGSVAIAWYSGNSRKASFDIQLSQDGLVWSTVYSGQSGGTTIYPELVAFPAQSARYVRVAGQGNTANQWNSITEVDIFSDPALARSFIDSFVDFDFLKVETSLPANSLSLGASSVLTLAGLPASAEDHLRFASNNENVLTVSPEGEVRGVGIGTAKVFAIVEMNQAIIYASAEITVDEPGVTKLLPVSDTYVYDAAPAVNYGAVNPLFIKDASTGYKREAYLQFDVSPLNQDIGSAVLYLYGYVNDAVMTEGPASVYLIPDDAWQENGLVWNNRPARGEEAGTVSFNRTWGWHQLDLTDDVLQEAAGDGKISLLIAQNMNGKGFGLSINSKEDSRFAPYLQIRPMPEISDNARLSDLTVSEGSLSPSFRSAVHDYEVRVGHEVNAITLTPTAMDARAAVTMTVYAPDGTLLTDHIPLPHGTAVPPIQLEEGATRICFEVTAQNGTDQRRYEATVVREPFKIMAAADTYVHDAAPAANFGSVNPLLIKDAYPGYQREAFLKFDLSAIEGEILSAELYVYGRVDDPAITEAAGTVFAVEDDSWQESMLNWNNRPAQGAALEELRFEQSWGWQSTDISAYVLQETAGDGLVSVKLAELMDRKGAAIYMKSREDAVFAPYLHIRLKP
ncbi:MAG: type protein [Paenibacillaceae bacterium]|jgi:hypothetical protein|nr:type protein [Paenibacillaceae bacterium]